MKVEDVQKWRYALVYLTGSSIDIIQKYPNTEQLETGYRDWKKFASEKGITKPVPVEFDSDHNCMPLAYTFAPPDLLLN